MRATPLLIITHVANSIWQRQVSHQHILRPFCISQSVEDRAPRKIDIRLTLMCQPSHESAATTTGVRLGLLLSTATVRPNDNTTRPDGNNLTTAKIKVILDHDSFSTPLNVPIRRRACFPSVLVCGFRGGALFLRRYRHMGIFRPYPVRGTKKA